MFTRISWSRYDLAVELWQDMYDGFVEMKETILSERILSEKEDKSMKACMATFWSSHQLFFKQLCMGAKVPHIVEQTKQALRDGNCVVSCSSHEMLIVVDHLRDDGSDLKHLS